MPAQAELVPVLVSILIPAYNAQSWIADTIQSALAQTWPRKEIVIVDDGSSDNTLAMAQQLVPRNHLVVTQSHQGAAAARNKAFSLCRGDYIQWLDADDLLAPDKIFKQMQALDGYRGRRILLSSAWGSFIYRVNKASFRPTPLWCDLCPIEWLIRKWEHNAHMGSHTWLVSRELTEAAGPWDTRLLGDDDGEYFFRVIRASEAIKFVPDAKVFYRMSGHSRLSYIGSSDSKMQAQFLGMQMQIDYLRSLRDTDRVQAACLKYLQTWLIHFYPERPDLVQQAEELAASLGGHLGVPELSWKYRWIRALLGWPRVKRIQQNYNLFKSYARRSWDKALFQLESGRH
jgi:glycosyltransferase involved in cell wall biosynthesis